MHVSTQVFVDNLSHSSSMDLYTRCRVNLPIESINPVVPQFLNHGISTVNVLNKSAGIRISSTRIRRLPDVIHFSTVDHDVGQFETVGDVVGENSDYSEKQ